jgi:hypothetical protein
MRNGGTFGEQRTMHSDVSNSVRRLTEEMENFEEIAKYLIPQAGDLPRLSGIDVHGGTIPLNGLVGGDHIIYVNFSQRFDLDARIQHGIDDGRLELVENLKRCHTMAGIAILDVSGHQITDAFMASMLHQACLLGAIYELDMFGQINFAKVGQTPNAFPPQSAIRKESHPSMFPGDRDYAAQGHFGDVERGEVGATEREIGHVLILDL